MNKYTVEKKPIQTQLPGWENEDGPVKGYVYNIIEDKLVVAWGFSEYEVEKVCRLMNENQDVETQPDKYDDRDDVHYQIVEAYVQDEFPGWENDQHYLGYVELYDPGGESRIVVYSLSEEDEKRIAFLLNRDRIEEDC